MNSVLRDINLRATVYVKYAISHDNISTLRDVYSYCEVDFVDQARNTPIHYAAKKGCRQTLWWLLHNTEKNTLDTNIHGQNAAHLATSKGHLGCLQDIMAVSNKKSILKNPDALGRTIYTIAEQKGHLRILVWLHENFKNPKGAQTTKASNQRSHGQNDRARQIPKHVTFVNC